MTSIIMRSAAIGVIFTAMAISIPTFAQERPMQDASFSIPNMDKKDAKKWDKAIKEIAKGEEKVAEGRKSLAKAEEKVAKITRELRKAQEKVAEANADIRKGEERIDDAQKAMVRIRRNNEQSYRGTDVAVPIEDGQELRPIAPAGTVIIEETDEKL